MGNMEVKEDVNTDLNAFNADNLNNINIPLVQDMDDTIELDFYNRYVRSIPVLTEEEEKECGYFIKNGTEEEKEKACKKLVQHNMRFVLLLAGKYQKYGYSFDDMVQNGLIGLMRAAHKFDCDLGFRFTTYASYWIRQAIERGAEIEEFAIRIPTHAHTKVIKIYQAERRIEATGANLTQEEKNKEISRITGYSLEEIAYIKHVTMQPTSLDKECKGDGEDNDATLGDFVASMDEAVEDQAMRTMISNPLLKAAKSKLTEKEYEVIIRRFGFNGNEPETLSEVGKTYGISRERVRQIEERALNKLRRTSDIRMLKEFIS